MASTTVVVGSSFSVEDTIKPSDEFVQIFKLAHTFSKDQSKLSKKQIRTTETKMNKLFHKVINSQNTKSDDIIVLAYAYEYVCFAYFKLNTKEKLSVAKDFILHCLHLIKDKELDPKVILLALKAYSHLYFINDKLQKLENTIEILDKALDLYLIYTEEHTSDQIPIDYEDIIIKPLIQIDGYVKLKSLYLHILDSSIKIHTKIGSENNESDMLTRHLILTEEFGYLLENEEYKEWIEKAMTVYDYLIMRNRFAEAKSYLDITTFVQRTFLHEKLSREIKEQGFFSETSKLYKQCLLTFKLINLCQVRYTAALFRQSVKRLLRLEKDGDSKTNNSTTEHPSKAKKQAPRRLLVFVPNKETDRFDLNIYHAKPVIYVLDYNKAQQSFASILNVIHKSGLYFRFHTDNVKLYVRCILYTSNAYKYMAFYEKNTTSRFLLLKRRTEILEETATILNDKNDCQLVGILRLQLAIAYSTLIDMKLEDIEATPLPYMTPRHDTIVVENNLLLMKGLLFLRKYKYYK